MFPSEQDQFFQLHRDKFPADFQETLDKYFELKEIFFNTEPQFFRTIHKPLWALMQQQFPYLRTTQNEEIIEHAKEINRILSFFLIYGFWNLLRLQKEKADLAKLYPRLQEWKEYYTRPSKPDQVTDKERNHLVHPSDEEWEKHKQKENEILQQIHQQEEAQRQQFYDIVQPVILRLMPELLNIEGDCWTIYAVKLRDNYEQWKSFAGRLDTILEYNMPPSSFMWDNKDFHEALYKKMFPGNKTDL